uniref:Uncharacterized protein n=1 Tax=Panagrolaimus superbus TaxID=310955 RepID=A0A914Y3N3_9BILA
MSYSTLSPEMTIEAIPIISYDESDVSIASETVNSGSRQYAGGEVTAIQNGDEIVETNPSMLNAMVNGLPTENASEIYRAYLNANDLTENEHLFLPKENDANYMSKENIVQWIKEGEKATTTSAPQQAEWEVTSMNSYSNLESILSTSEKVDYGIREINHDGCRDDETLKDVISLASVDESDSIASSDFSDVPIIHTPHPSGSRGGNIEEAMKRRTPKTNQ